MSEPELPKNDAGWADWIAVLLLSLTTLLTAISAFQAGKWDGEMATAFSESASLRIEASRLEGVANRKSGIQVGLFNSWLAADSLGQARVQADIAAVFPAPLDQAFPAWRAAVARGAAQAPKTPFEMSGPDPRGGASERGYCAC